MLYGSLSKNGERVKLAQLSDSNVFDPKIIECPWAFDALLRQRAPVYFDEAHNIYLVSTYELISYVLQSPDLYSSRYMEKMLSKEPFPDEVLAIYAQGYPLRDALLVTDGETHDRHRRIITTAFSRKRLTELAPALEARMDSLLNAAMPKGHMRFREEVAQAVPLLITEQQLRIPAADMPKAREWSEILSSGFGGIDKSLAQMKHEARDMVAFQKYFAAKIETEMNSIRATGKGYREDDLLTLLAGAILDPADPMDMPEAISFLINLFPATHDTTTTTMMACVQRFTEHPNVQKAVRSNPAAISKLIEETIRHETPIRAWWRRATRDVTLAGVDIPADSWLLMRVSAAHRDDAAYVNPDVFDIERTGGRAHLGFSTGMHICAGRFFARHIISRTIAKLSERATHYRFVPGANDFSHAHNLLASGYRELVIEFDALATPIP